MDFLTLSRNRYSCKQYSPHPLEDDRLSAILEAGRYAPTARNLQEQHIYVARTPDSLAAIDRHTPCRYGAPVVLAVAYNTENVYTYPGGKDSSGAEDATIVATHMMLSAASLHVDSCWINKFDPDELAHELGLPQNERIVMLLDLGYAAEGSGPLPNHFSRKPLEETVTYLE